MDAYLVGLPENAAKILADEIGTIKKLSPKKLVCLAPESQRVFSGGVPGLETDGIGIPVISFSQYMGELQKEGKLKFAGQGKGASGKEETVSWHDSDQGGRFLEEYDAPREALEMVCEAVQGLRYKELFWSKGQAASAGESGAISFLDPDLSMKIVEKRLEQITGREIDILVTDSPEAKKLLEKQANDDLHILHIAEFMNNYL